MSKQPVSLSGFGVCLLNIRERENVGRVEESRKRACIARCFGEAVIETAAPASRNVRVNPVEDRAIALVGIEAFVEKVPQESSGLRNAETVSAADGNQS